MYTEEEIAAELDKDEDFDYKKVLDMYRVSPEAFETVSAKRYQEAGERKVRAILYKHALVQQRLASQREKRERSLLPEVPVTVDEAYWASLTTSEPVDEEVWAQYPDDYDSPGCLVKHGSEPFKFLTW